MSPATPTSSLPISPDPRRTARLTTMHGSPFGALLRRYRKAARLTQEELAERAGISLRGLVALENGERLRPRGDTVRLLADALQITGETRLHFNAAARGHNAFLGQAPDPSLKPLVGRAKELELLEWHMAGHGPQVLALAGEPGIGKTRLLRHAAQQAARLGRAVFVGGCQRRSGQEPYAPFPQALARYLASLPATTLKEALQESPRLVRLLPELAPLLPDPVVSSPLEAGQERRLLFGAVVNLLAKLAHPAGGVLLLDDLHWAPADALDLLTAIVHEPASAPIRIVCAYRSTDVQPAEPLALLLADLAHAGLARQWTVDALSPDEAQQLLSSLLDGLDPRSAIAQRAARRAGGVPFYLVSYAHELRVQGAVQSDDVPWDVAHSLRQRVASLPPLSREILAVASVTGRVVRRMLLAAVIGGREAEVLAGLEAACRGRLLEEANEHEYHFPHDVIREVVGADLGAARRQALHRRIAEVLEQLPERTSTGGAAELAWHFLEGGDPEHALRYSLVAAGVAEAVFAHEEADHHYRVALELARTGGDEAREAQALEGLGWLLWIAARYDEALDALERAATVQHGAENLEAEGQIVAKIGWVLSQMGRPQEGITRLQTAAAQLEDKGPSPALAVLYTALVHLFVRQGQTRNAVSMAERASTLAEAVGDDRMRVEGEMNRGLALVWQDRLEEALPVLENVIPRARQMGDAQTEGRALGFVAGICAGRGEFDRSKRYWERLIAIRERAGSPDYLATALTGLGGLLVMQGDWGGARADYERAADMTSALTSHQAGWVRMSLARLCLLEGKWQEAGIYIQEAMGVVERTGDRQSVQGVQVLLAERDLLQGRPAVACARLEPLLNQLDLGNDVLMVLADAYVEVGNVARAHEVMSGEAVRAAVLSSRLVLTDWRRLEGMLMAEQGRWHEADRALSEAVSLASGMSYPYARARALYAWGRACLRRGRFSEARVHLADALAIFRQLCAQPYVERAEQLLNGETSDTDAGE